MKAVNIIILTSLVLSVVFIAGCTSENQTGPITEITIPGHNNIYTFNNDIRKAVLYKAENEQQIRELFMNKNHLNIVFNGTDEADNGMFRLALIDITSKVPFYMAYEGRSLSVDIYYFMAEDGTQWYNYQSEPIDPPALSGLVLWLKGPATGATDNSILLENTTIILQGMTQKNLSLAADKLTLAVFGINAGNVTALAQK